MFRVSQTDFLPSSVVQEGENSSVESKQASSSSKSNVLHFVRGENVSLQEATNEQARWCQQVDADALQCVWDSKEQPRQFL